MLTFVRGDMFERPADIRVNTVNCVGVMGAGVALAFKARYPEMFRAYKKACQEGQIQPGRLDVWKTLTDWIINFPTKQHWRDKSRYEDIQAGLEALRDYLAKQGGVRVALPALGCGHGGLDWNRVSGMIRDCLGDLDAEIFVFEPADSIAAGHRVAQAKNELLPDRSGNQEIRLLRKGDLEYPDLLCAQGIDCAYILGEAGLFTRPWLTFALSEKPGDRETAAAMACMQAIARPGVTVAFRYGGQLPRRLSEAALAHEAHVLLWAAEGMHHVRLPKELASQRERGRLAVISLARPTERWSATAARRISALTITLAQAVLITDPAAEGLPQSNGARISHGPALFYVRYDDAPPPAAVRRLKAAGARPIGRRSGTGLPNVTSLLSVLAPPGDTENDVPSASSGEPERHTTEQAAMLSL